jgi:hypothetical protein
VAHGVYQPDELALIGCQLGVSRSDRLAEEGRQSSALVEDDPEAVARRVAFGDEVVGEVRKL